jgi:hypothetical protein
MADRADVFGIDVAQRFQEIDRPDVVPDGLHRAAGIERLVAAGDLLLEVVRLVVAEARIIRDQANEPSLGKLMAVVPRRLADQPGRLGLPVGIGRVQAQHCRRLCMAPTIGRGAIRAFRNRGAGW